MSWVTLALRKAELKRNVNSLTYEDLQLSRSLRALQRHSQLEKTAFQTEKSKRMREAKNHFDEIRKNKSEYLGNSKYGDEDYASKYNDWKDVYEDAKLEYEQYKTDLEDEYDAIFTEIEEEANDEETWIQDQITYVETQRDAQQAELQAIQDQIKTEIENSTIKF